MDVAHPRCAGIDCSKKDAKVCIRVQGQGSRRASSMVTTWGATTSQILALREHLIAEKVTCVVIESTSDYWRPFYYLLDDALNMMLVNASRARNVPGRKTDLLTGHNTKAGSALLCRFRTPIATQWPSFSWSVVRPSPSRKLHPLAQTRLAVPKPIVRP
jgi:hypothetical protein